MKNFRPKATIWIGVVIAILLGACDRPMASDDSAPEVVGQGAGPPPPPSGSFLAQLRPEQTDKLNALDIEVAVPTGLPLGFTVADVQTETASSEAGGGSRYRIIYQDGRDRCFAIEFTSGRVREMPATEYRLPIAPLLFDQEYGLNLGQYQDPNLRVQFPEPELTTDWMAGASGFYRLAGAAYINSTISGYTGCQDITSAEAVQIVESMIYLQPGIVGDG